MKKSFKKTIAFLISVLMIISSMPFTAMTASAATNSALESAITAYETKMDGKVYTNMKPAYDAYVNAKKAQEVLKYGDTESYDADAYARALSDATDAMKAWTAPYGNQKVRMSSDTEDITSASAYGDANHTNILYAKGITNANDGGWQYATGGNNARFAFNSNPVAVFLYDGTTIKIPVMCGFVGKGGSTATDQYMRSFYPTDNTKNGKSDTENDKANDNSLFKLSGIWNGYYRSSGKDTGEGAWKWLSAWNGETTKDTMAGYNNATSNQSADTSPGSKNTSNMMCFSNTLEYKGGTSAFNNGLATTTIGWFGYAYTETRVIWTQKYPGSYAFKDCSTYYVIDYATAKNAINGAKKAYLSQIKDIYTQGGMSNILEKYDALTAVNPTTANYSSDTAKVATDMASDLQTKASALTNAATPTPDQTYKITINNASGTTLATYNMSKACTAKTVEYALNALTPAMTTDAEYHTTYSWDEAVAVTENKTYTAKSSSQKHSDTATSKVKSNATCTADEVDTYTCAVDGKTWDVTVENSATGHDYGDFAEDWTEYVDDETDYTHTKVCANDETHKVTEDCSFSAWEISAEDETLETRECSGCHAVQTREHQVGMVTITFQLPDGTGVGSETVEPGTEVDAPSLDSHAFNDAEGHHTYSWSADKYTVDADIIEKAIANEVEAHTTAKRNVNLKNVDAETLLATSCDEDKTYSYDIETYCTVCDEILDTDTQPVTALTHTYNETSYSKKDTDSHNITCAVCKAITGTDQHHYSPKVVEPTCAEEGYTIYTCTECKDTYNGDFQNKKAHTYEYISNGNGTHTRRCTVCNSSDIFDCSYNSEVVPATCTDNMKLASVCSVCGEIISPVDLYGSNGTVDGSVFVTNVISQTGGSTDNKHYKSVASESSAHRYIDLYGNVGSGKQIIKLPFVVDEITIKLSNHTYSASGGNSWIDVYDHETDGTRIAHYDGNSQKFDETFTLTNTDEIVFTYDLKRNQDFLVLNGITLRMNDSKALGHAFNNYITNDDGVVATCQTKGVTASQTSKCDRCDVTDTIPSVEGDYDMSNHTNIVDDLAVENSCTETGLTAGKHCADCGTITVAQQTVQAAGHDYEGQTWVDRDDADAHYMQCTVCELYSKSEAHNPAEGVRENPVAPTASKAGSYDLVVYCEDCGYEISRTETVDPATGDYTSYNAAVESAKALKQELYTTDSWTNLQTALADAKTMADDAVTQKDIDDAAAMINTAVTDLEKIGYVVTVYQEKNGVQYGETIEEIVSAGDVYTYTADGDEQIYKATIDDKRIVNNNKSFKVVVTSNIEITVYLADDVPVTDIYTATYMGINGVTVAVKYYDTIDKIDSNHPTGPSVPFYEFIGWELQQVNDKEYIYMATYVPVLAEEEAAMCNIIGVDGVLVKGEDQYNAYYDEIVGFDSQGRRVGMYADAACNNLLAIVDSTFYMHAPHRDIVYIRAIDDPTDFIGITGMYSYIDNAGMQTVAFNCNKFGSATEMGIIATVNPKLAARTDLFTFAGIDRGIGGMVVGKSEKQSSIGEFTVSIHSDFGSYTTVYARPYMLVGGEYVYGDVVELEIAQRNA